MPGTLNATPINPGTLTDAAVTPSTGTYPGSDNFPGSDHYPGRGGTLSASAIQQGSGFIPATVPFDISTGTRILYATGVAP